MGYILFRIAKSEASSTPAPLLAYYTTSLLPLNRHCLIIHFIGDEVVKGAFANTFLFVTSSITSTVGIPKLVEFFELAIQAIAVYNDNTPQVIKDYLNGIEIRIVKKDGIVVLILPSVIIVQQTFKMHLKAAITSAIAIQTMLSIWLNRQTVDMGYGRNCEGFAITYCFGTVS